MLVLYNVTVATAVRLCNSHIPTYLMEGVTCKSYMDVQSLIIAYLK